MPSTKPKSYWQTNLALLRYLLAIWAFFSFGTTIVLAKFLNRFELGQLPFGFWMAQQGSLLVFIGLIFGYAFKMSELDRIHDLRNAKAAQNESVKRDS